MVSARCKMAVKEVLKSMDLHFVVVDLGEVDIMEDLTLEQLEKIKAALLVSGLELIEDKKANSRPKDISDIEKLKNSRKEND